MPEPLCLSAQTRSRYTQACTHPENSQTLGRTARTATSLADARLGRLAVSALPHRSLIASGTIAEVRLTGLSFSLHESSAQEVQNGSS